MPGEHNNIKPRMPESYYKNEAHKNAMTAPLVKNTEYDENLEQRAREAGL